MHAPADLPRDDGVQGLQLPSFTNFRAIAAAGTMIAMVSWLLAGKADSLPTGAGIAAANPAAASQEPAHPGFTFQNVSAAELRTQLQDAKNHIGLALFGRVQALIDEILTVDPATKRDLVDELFLPGAHGRKAADANGDKVLSAAEIQDCCRSIKGVKPDLSGSLPARPEIAPDSALSPRARAIVTEYWAELQQLHTLGGILRRF